MNKIRFGEYYNTNSIIHRLDARVKIIAVILFMIGIFLVPNYDFYLLGSLVLFTIICIILSKVPLIRYLKSIKQILFLLIFTFVLQVIFRDEGNLLYTLNLHYTWFNILIIIGISLLFFFLYKYLRLRFIILIALIAFSIYILTFPIGSIKNHFGTINVYDVGLKSAAFICLRVLTLIIFSNILTLTTKSTDLNNALESLLKPLEKLHIKTSIFSMMVSIALRFIPTLFNEMDKILKAQSSRGSDFNEGSLRKKIKQVISILVPMFIISFKRADDLSLAMEARGYVPGEARTKLNVLKFRILDYFVLFGVIIFTISLIILRIVL